MYWYVTWTREKQVSAFFTLMSLRTFDSWRSTGHRSLDSGFNQDLDVDQFLVHRKHPFHASNHGVDKKEVKTKRSRRSKLFPVTLCFIIIFLIELAEILKLYGKATAGMTSSTFLSSLKAHFTLVWGDLSRGFGFGDGNVTKSWEELSTLEIFLTSMLFQMNLSLKMVKGFAILLCIAGVALIYRSSGELVEYLNKETDQVHVKSQQIEVILIGVLSPRFDPVGYSCLCRSCRHFRRSKIFWKPLMKSQDRSYSE